MITRLGVRTRLAAAMALIAVAAVGLSIGLANHGLDDRLDGFSRAHVRDAAARGAELAASLYRPAAGSDGWSPGALRALRSQERTAGYAISLTRADAGARRGETSESAAVVVGGRAVGRVNVAPLPDAGLAAEERTLNEQLDRTRNLGVALAVVLALLAAAVVALSLVRPLRRLTDAAEQMQRGDLDVRLPRGGGAEIERLRGALQRLAATLRRENELRRTAAADVAHELRTPVAGIVARIEAAQDGVMANPRANLESMRVEALRLARLRDDVGLLAEAEAPELEVRRAPLDLGAVAAGRVRAHREQFAAKDITLRHAVAAVLVDGDERRLEQVIDNLLSNALRYTDRGGKVRVEVRQTSFGATLEVRDTGIGIPAADAEHVFERFWRADQSRSRATGGAGIGLAVVRELVLAHGGRVELTSAVGAGTTFRVVLPRLGTPATQPRHTAAQPMAVGVSQAAA